MPVITVTGKAASGARDVGRIVANQLGIDFVDQQLMVQAAQRCGVPVGVMAAHDERYASFRKRLSSAINTLLERSAAPGADPLTGATGLEAVLSQTYAEMARDPEEKTVSDSTYQETMAALVRELAASGQIVILGRGSQMILRDLPRALHVLCTAPDEVRCQRIAERDEIGMDEARKRGAETDQARAAFYRKFWKVDVEDPQLYDLTIDTSRLSYEAAAEVVATAARLKSEGDTSGQGRSGLGPELL
jgi:cytidylate kinase